MLRRDIRERGVQATAEAATERAPASKHGRSRKHIRRKEDTMAKIEEQNTREKQKTHQGASSTVAGGARQTP